MSSEALQGVGDDVHQPPDPLRELPREGHGSDYLGRELPPPPLPGLFHMCILGTAEALPPLIGPLYIRTREEYKAYGGRGCSVDDSDGVLGLLQTTGNNVAI